MGELREIGKAFIAEEESVAKRFIKKPFRQLKKKIRKRKAEKRRIKGIFEQETRKLERKVIRRAARVKLEKKFIKKRRMMPAQKARPGQPKRNVGEDLLRGLGGFGMTPVVARPKPKPKKKTITISF